MTKDLARQSELKKMALCDGCAGIQRNWRRAPGHAELVQGANRKEEHGHGLVTINSVNPSTSDIVITQTSPTEMVLRMPGGREIMLTIMRPRNESQVLGHLLKGKTR